MDFYIILNYNTSYGSCEQASVRVPCKVRDLKIAYLIQTIKVRDSKIAYLAYLMKVRDFVFAYLTRSANGRLFT